MFLNILEPEQISLLEALLEKPPAPHAYLAGGTGLALLYGHRKSVDFDWFSTKPFDILGLQRKLSAFGNMRIAETSEGTFSGWINDIRVSWFHYPDPLIDDLVRPKEKQGLSIASPRDIGLMKWAALAARGARKDFIDIYELDMHGILLECLYDMLPLKFPAAVINRYHMLKSLSWFEDAEKEPWPIMIRDIAWGEVKDRFLKIQKTLFQRISPENPQR